MVELLVAYSLFLFFIILVAQYTTQLTCNQKLIFMRMKAFLLLRNSAERLKAYCAYDTQQDDTYSMAITRELCPYSSDARTVYIYTITVSYNIAKQKYNLSLPVVDLGYIQ